MTFYPGIGMDDERRKVEGGGRGKVKGGMNYERWVLVIIHATKLYLRGI